MSQNWIDLDVAQSTDRLVDSQLDSQYKDKSNMREWPIVYEHVE